MATMIDTLKTSKTLEEAGFAKPQADALAVTFAEATSASRENLVTKEYLQGQLAELKGDLQGQLAELKGDLRAEMANNKAELIRWVLASQAMLLVAVVALSNFSKLL